MGRSTGRSGRGGGRKNGRAPGGRGAAAGPTIAEPRGRHGLSAAWLHEPACVAVIVLAGVAAYANSFAGQFVLDDQITIIHNPLIRQALPLRRFFDVSQPLTDLSLAINYAFGALDPWGYHLFNLGVHVVAGLALFGVIRRTLRSPRMGSRAYGATGFALAAALLWLVHPLQTESVTYVIQRCESMAGMFYLLTLYFFLRYSGATSHEPDGVGDASGGRGRRLWGIAAVAACACGMATKPIVVTVPVVVLLYDRTFLAGGFGEAIRRRWPVYLGLAAGWLVLWGLGTIDGLLNESSETATVGFGYQGVTPLAYLRTQPEILLHYLRLAVWPVGQCLDYGWRVCPTWREAALPAAVVAALVAGTAWATWLRRPAGFLGCWFFLILSPTSSFVPIKDLAFEHRMYLPLASVVVLIVSGVQAVVGRLGSARAKLARWVLVGTATALLAVLTIRRNALYADATALWSDNVAKAPHHARAWNGLGYALLAAGETTRAIENFRKAVQLEPDFAEAYANLGKAYFSMGRMENAVREFRIAWSLKPGAFWADTHFYFGAALLETERYSEAVDQLQLAIGKNSQYRAAYYNLANALWAMGDRDRAAAVFQQALAVDPGYTEAAVNLGLVKAEQGKLNEAVASYRSAIGGFRPGGNPDALTKAHYNLGLAFKAMGRVNEAMRAFEQALRVNPSHEASRRALEESRRGAESER
ncbi:MAG: hypothetical protein DCC65_14915 [Planctomycetota bacterium]|nr:MAG: hypothetical protein DCC65_14915 [Planctomycetota bacterium]